MALSNKPQAAYTYLREKTSWGAKQDRPDWLGYDDPGWQAKRTNDESINVFVHKDTGKYMTNQQATILRWLHDSWYQPYDSGFSWDYSFKEEHKSEWAMLRCAVSEYNPPPGDHHTAYELLKEYLGASNWKEDEDYYFGWTGRVNYLMARVYDQEAQKPTDFVRWWMHSGIRHFVNREVGFAEYPWPDHLFLPIETENMLPDIDLEERFRQIEDERLQEKYTESLQWVFGDEFWTKGHYEWTPEEKGTLYTLLYRAGLFVDHGETNEYYVKHTYDNKPVWSWLSPIVAGMVGMLEDEPDEDEFLPKYPKGQFRDELVVLWRMFYDECKQVSCDAAILEAAETILDNHVPKVDTYFRNHEAGGRVREQEQFAAQFSAVVAAKITHELTTLMVRVKNEKENENG